MPPKYKVTVPMQPLRIKEVFDMSAEFDFVLPGGGCSGEHFLWIDLESVEMYIHST